MHLLHKTAWEAEFRSEIGIYVDTKYVGVIELAHPGKEIGGV